MKNYSKKVIQVAGILLIGAALLISCKNGFFQSYEAGEIEFTLPYGKSQAQARDASGTSYNFEITFVHTSSNAKKVITGKSGDTITYKNAAPGSYDITAQAFDSVGTWEFDGTATADVQRGRTTSVDLILKRIIRVWAQNEDLRGLLELYLGEHSDCGFTLDYKSFDSEEAYIAALKKALTSNDPNGPDIYFVESYRTYDFVKGAYKDYAMPYSNLGIDTETALNEAQILNYIQTLGTDYTESNRPVLKALGYQSTIGFYAYNKELATLYLGSDDPETVETKMFRGGQSGDSSSWSHFVEKAQSFLYDQAYHLDVHNDDTENLMAIPNLEFLQEVVLGSGESWVTGIDTISLSNTRSEAFLTAQELEYFTMGHYSWSDEWYNDMTNKAVLGFFGPVWMVDYVLEGGDDRWGICNVPTNYYQGGYFTLVNNKLAAKKKNFVKDFVYWLTLDSSTNGFMYRIASRQIDGITEAVASLRVQSLANDDETFLGDTNMFRVYKNAAENFIINRDAGKYHYEIMNILNEKSEPILAEDSRIAPRLLQVVLANELGLEVNTSSINPYINGIMTVTPDGSNGIKFTFSDNGYVVTEISSGILAGMKEMAGGQYNLYYPFTQAGKWYLFDISKTNSYIYAIKAQGGITCPVTWDEEFFGYENWGDSIYLPEPEIHDSISYTFNNGFANFIHFSSNVTEKWLELNGQYHDNYSQDNPDTPYFQPFFSINCRGDLSNNFVIEFPTDPNSTTNFSFETQGTYTKNPRPNERYYVEVGVDFQIDGTEFSNNYYRVPTIRSYTYNYPLN